MGMGELLIIAVAAVIFLGPDKLPNAMVQTAKFIRSVRQHLTEAKSAMDQELKLTELKNDALEYKNKLEREVGAGGTNALQQTASDVQQTSREVRDLFGELTDLSGDFQEGRKPNA